jgi:uncharacterized protein
MNCRLNCGACCIAPSISSPIPGMPNGKPAGVPCVQLTKDYKCKIFGQASRPQVCINFRPEEIVCGNNREEAFKILIDLES